MAHYAGECAEFVDRPNLFPVSCQDPPKHMDIPTSRWLLSVYGRDIITRIDHIKASITSIFGSILKLDSTKKVINIIIIITVIDCRLLYTLLYTLT